MYYITTDTHFNHPLMLKIGRPADYEDRIFKSMQQLSEDDVLIHLGDICIGKDQEMHDQYIKPLRCKKILVRGNHDKKSDTWYYKNGWDFVCDQFMIKKYGKEVVFSHMPVMEGSLLMSTKVNIHGHLHTMEHRQYELGGTPEHILISIERDGCQVQSLKSILDRQHK